MTRQKRLILDLMRQSPRHMTADEIFAQARQQMPNIARGTVYRNLKLMEQAREIARLLHMTEHNVNVRLSRGREKLRRRFTESEREETRHA